MTTLNRRISAPSAGLLVGPAADLVLVFGVGGALAMAFAVSISVGTGFVLFSTAFAVMSDLPHVLQTTVRVSLDPDERARHGRHYLVSLAAFATFVGVGVAVGAIRFVLLVWVVWQIFHVLKQHHGMVAIYAAKAKFKGSRTTAKRALMAGCLAPVVYRVSQGMAFGEYEVFGDRLPFSGLVVPLPQVPVELSYAAFLAAAVFVAAFIVEQIRLTRDGEARLPTICLGTIAGAILSYNLAYLLVDDLYALILIAASVHSIQYHVISWARHNGRFRAAPAPATDRPGRFLEQLTRRNMVAAYVSFIWVTALLVATTESMWFGAIPTTLVLHHFYFDRTLWRGSSNPDLVAHLGMNR